MASVDIKVNLITKAAELQLKKLGNTAKGTGRDLENAGRRAKGFGKDFGTSFRQSSLAFGRFGTLLRAGLVGGTLFGIGAAIRRTVKDFREFELALIGVGKTTGLEGQALQQFGSEIQELGKNMPVATNELLKLAQVAAQLGIRGTSNLKKFADVGARLGVSTNLGAEEAVTALTRIINITGESVDNIDLVGSALVRLGNNFNASESEILSVANRVARSTSAFKVSADQVLAISTALRESGVQAQAGGTAIGTALTEISKAVANGGQKLEDFTEITGLTGDQLKKSLLEDGGETFKVLIEGLRRSSKDGVELTSNLQKLGLGSKRVFSAIAPLVQNVQSLKRAFQESSDGIKSNSDLFDESNKQFNTINGVIVTLNNEFTRLFTNLGKANSGIIKDFLLGTKSIASAIADILQDEADLPITKKLIEAKSEVGKITLELGRARIARKAFNEEGSAEDQQYYQQQTDKIKEIETRLEAAKEKKKDLDQFLSIQAGAGAPVNNDLPDDTGDSGAVKRKQQENSKLLELQQELFLAQYEQRLSADGVFDELDDLRLMRVKDSILQAREFEKISAAESLGDAQKLAQLKTQVEIDRVKRKSNIDKAEAEQEKERARLRLSTTGNLFGALASLAQAGGKKSFAAYKLLAKGEAVISGYLAVQKALASVPYPFNIAAAATIGIQTAANVANINAQQPPAYQNGGVVPGENFTGDNVLARVNSGEMILNRAQQAQLFNQANGTGGASGSQETVVNTVVEIDGEAITKAVSRQVANGAELGELI